MRATRILDLVLCVLVVSSAIVSIVVAMRLYGVESGRLQRERQAVAELQADLTRAEGVLAPLQAVLAATRQESAALDRKIPPRGRIGEFLALLDGHVARHGISLQAVAPDPAVREHPYARVPVRLQFAGSFEAVYGFLCELEQMDRAMEMSALRISAPGEDECQVSLTTSLFER